MSDFQTWAQSIDPKVWSKNDLHYSKLAWDEGRKELEADVKFLLSFAPQDTLVPSHLDPTFHHTLSAEGDQKIADRIAKIKLKVIE